MIVVVEGPSAAGKTTWVRRYHGDVEVPEYRRTGAEPRAGDVDRAASYWMQANAERWRQARTMEAQKGLAVCDTDPLKLHYVWTLWRIGAATRREWEAQAAVARATFDRGDLGLADLILVEIPAADTLQQRKGADATRTRSNFELHGRLAEPLRDWYSAVEAVEPGRVRWSWPRRPVHSGEVAPRQRRSGGDTFDRLLDALPAS